MLVTIVKYAVFGILAAVLGVVVGCIFTSLKVSYDRWRWSKL